MSLDRRADAEEIKEQHKEVEGQTGVCRFRIEGFSPLQRRTKFRAVSSGPILDVGGAQWELMVYPKGNE
eukprot:2755283-Lingulodinium_polyedra.AAC.1